MGTIKKLLVARNDYIFYYISVTTRKKKLNTSKWSSVFKGSNVFQVENMFKLCVFKCLCGVEKVSRGCLILDDVKHDIYKGCSIKTGRRL